MTPYKLLEKIDHDYYSCDESDEISNENMMNAAAALSSINNVPKTKSLDTLCIWMVLFVSMRGQQQRRDF